MKSGSTLFGNGRYLHMLNTLQFQFKFNLMIFIYDMVYSVYYTLTPTFIAELFMHCKYIKFTLLTLYSLICIFTNMRVYIYICRVYV